LKHSLSNFINPWEKGFRLEKQFVGADELVSLQTEDLYPGLHYDLVGPTHFGLSITIIVLKIIFHPIVNIFFIFTEK